MKRGIRNAVSLLLALLCVFSCFACAGKKPDDGTTEGDTDMIDPNNGGTPGKEVLYNGIELPDVWPPRTVSLIYNEPIDVPYLRDIDQGGTHPEVVNINVGRQLFVDDFLIDQTTLNPSYHSATPYSGNPILVPVTTNAWGKHCKHGGLYYDDVRKVFQLWLNVESSLFYYESTDGINWSEGEFCVKAPGYATVVKNPNPENEWQNYVMLLRKSNGTFESMEQYAGEDHNTYPFEIYISRDGKNWSYASKGGQCNDATSIFYNPFRKKWVASLRKSYSTLVRVREYFECDDIVKSASKSDLYGVFWMRADGLDIKDPKIKMNPQIYSVSCVAYESIMLAGIQLMLGPENKDAEKTGIPKVTDIHLAYSRDGFYYSRPSRDPILRSSQVKDAWDRGYLHQINTLCVVNGDELWFYYFGYKGDEERANAGVANNGTLDNGSLGLATMRRDGFVSMDGSGELLTRKMTCTEGQKYLFVNAKASSLKAEILDENGNVIPGYGMDDCVAFSGDSTCSMIQWKNGKEISGLSGTNFRIRFSVESGEFYSFWVSATEDGNSNGYYAGGLVGAN